MKNLEFDNLFGIFLVIGSLLFDGLTSSQTDKEHKSSGRDYAYSIMFSNAIVQLGANIVMYTFAALNGDDTIERILASPVLTRDVLMISLSGALG